ncbi:MAG: DUF4124 domain-containing protein [Desulfobacterales bacterium]
MKLLVLLPVLFLLLCLPSIVCGNEIFIWYDENGRAHYTQDPPPANARTKSGENWWQEDEIPGSDAISGEGLDVVDTSLSQSAMEVGENSIHEEMQAEEHFLDEEEDVNLNRSERKRKSKKKGFFSFFKRDREDNDCDEYAWLVENYGICPLDEPKKDVIGSTFRAKVVDSSKGVWSSCKGTRNGDVYVFKNKGEGLWETDGGVPECPFYESFYWR